MESILSLFAGSTQMKIIENKELNDELCKLAIILNSYVTNANNNVIKSISNSITRTKDFFYLLYLKHHIQTIQPIVSI